MVAKHQRIGDSLVFNAGGGEWFNQPGVFLDMGDDVEPRPPSQWHVELRQAFDAQETTPQVVVIDLTGMAALSIGWDLGFLIGLTDELSQHGTRVAVAGPENFIRAARAVKLSLVFEVYNSVDEALGRR